jgi:hypothetical protein
VLGLMARMRLCVVIPVQTWAVAELAGVARKQQHHRKLQQLRGGRGSYKGVSLLGLSSIVTARCSFGERHASQRANCGQPWLASVALTGGGYAVAMTAVARIRVYRHMPPRHLCVRF